MHARSARVYFTFGAREGIIVSRKTAGWNMNAYDAASRFLFDGRITDVSPYGNGHINDTYAVSCEREDGKVRYILQRLNANVFPDRAGLMRNMIAVTDFLRGKVEEDGGDPERECLRLIPDKDGERYYTSPEGEVWRATQFIENTDAYLVADDDGMFRDAGRAFGKFVARLADFDAGSLFEVIPDFHNTVKRFAAFERALAEDVKGRAASAAAETEFVLARKEGCSVIVDALASGGIPTRVTHNDTKLNNVLIDVVTKRAVCVIDLDTVMPGSMLYDFGDGVRAGCSTAKEDEPDLDKVDFDLGLFRAFADGFLCGMEGRVTERERQLMPDAARLMTFECGMRFLTDYLSGDTYFKTAYPEHNLVRARTQFRLVRRMEELAAEMAAAVAASAGKR